jgi:SGNH hydrolase-like domain, acetyltransferase AlgX
MGSPSIPDEGELDSLVAMLHEGARRCAELGILYIPALVPRKRDVIAPQPSPAREWVKGLNARLRDVDEVELLDLLEVLRDGAARHGGAYHRTDADWNDRGAFYVARALLKEAHKRVPALRPPALAQMRARGVPEYRGTLTDALLFELAGGELRPCEREVEAELGVAVEPDSIGALRMPVEQALAQAGSVHLRVYAALHQDPHARLAILGDSAALGLLPWLAEHTSRTTFFWTPELPLAQLELELPRAVLHLMREMDVERAAAPR